MVPSSQKVGDLIFLKKKYKIESGVSLSFSNSVFFSDLSSRHVAVMRRLKCGVKVYQKCTLVLKCPLTPSTIRLNITMFAARRIVTSIAPRVALSASVRTSVVAPTLRKSVASTTSIARFLNTNAIEQKRATVQRNEKAYNRVH